MKSIRNRLTALMAIVVLIVVSGIGMTTAIAGSSAEAVIKERKALMKEVVLKQLKAMKQMVKDDFIDAGAASKGMTEIAKVAEEFAMRFPKGTETGFETTAGPKIWQDMADFKAKFVKMAADAKAASAAASKDDGSFKGAFVTVAKNCKGCHEDYRIKKK